MLVSPLDKEPPLLAPGVPCSYGTSLGRLSGRAEKVAHLPLAWDRVEFVPGKRGVLFFDGHVETLPGARFAALMQQVELAGAGKERPTPPLPKRPEPLLPRPKPPKQADTELIGGPRGGPFRLTSPTAEPMLGLRCSPRPPPTR
jgi:prepilin-type processing-associated H-X9-DG protein